MSRWFRFYDETLNDPKTLKLSDKTFRVWVGILCAASKNDGKIPLFDDLVLMLRMKPTKLQPEIEKLIAAELIDHDDDGMKPHNWDKRQFISDSSVERVKRHRAKRAANGLQSQWTVPKALRHEVYQRDSFECVYCGSEDDLTIDHKTPELRGGTHDIDNLQTACRSCNGAKRDMTHEEYVSRNGDVTLLKRPQSTEQITEQKTEKKDIRAVAPATRPLDAFEEFWKVYPKRLGANPKAPALKQFEAAVKAGATPEEIINGAKRCAVSDRDKIGTPYIPQAVKWLRDRRWEDYQPPATAGPVNAPPPGAPSDEELRKRYGQPVAVPTKTETACPNGGGADHAGELPRSGGEIRPSLRPM